MDNDDSLNDSFVQGDDLVEGIYDQSDNLILFSDTGIITNHNLTQHLMEEEYTDEDNNVEEDERETPETVCYREAEPRPDIPAEPRDVFIEDLEQEGMQEGHDGEQEGVEPEEHAEDRQEAVPAELDGEENDQVGQPPSLGDGEQQGAVGPEPRHGRDQKFPR